MILYIILLIIIGFFSYFMGSLDSRNVASVFVFKRELSKLGRGNVWISNFRRIYGIGGFIKLFLVEVIKDLLPVLLGGLILSIKGHGEVGRAFAGFCMVFGTVFPVLNRFKGSSAAIALAVAAIGCKASVGIAVAIVVLAVTVAMRYLAVATGISALAMIIVGVLEIENSMTMLLCILTAVIVIIKNIPAIRRTLNGAEERIAFVNDISYKFDEKF